MNFDKVFEEALAAYDAACDGQRCEDGPRYAAETVLGGWGDDEACAAMLLLTGMEVKGGFRFVIGQSADVSPRRVRVPKDFDDTQGVTEALIAQHCGLAPAVFEED